MASVAASIIAIVDDDRSVRESLHGLLRSVGYRVTAFTSAEEFLNSDQLDKADCLMLDVRMPGMTGLELQRELKIRGVAIPIVFVTAQGDEELRSQALEAGAVAFLVKPLSEEVVLTALNRALGLK